MKQLFGLVNFLFIRSFEWLLKQKLIILKVNLLCFVTPLLYKKGNWNKLAVTIYTVKCNICHIILFTASVHLSTDV